ncbi:hypothetical protein ACVLD2_000446 [Paenibacillus sp. PvR052]
MFNRKQKVIGAVASFRNKSELYRLDVELSQVNDLPKGCVLKRMNTPTNSISSLA